jgi:RNA polymerase sigma-70 factor (ECF subfamily)
MKRRLAETTDRDLANALLRDGDEDAFRELYARHTGRLYQFVLRMLAGAEVEAEDVVQETWLTGIGINLCRDRLRKRGREVDAKEGTVTPVVAPAVHEERIDLERAIALLPAGYREVLILHDVEGFTHGEIGERLGIAEGTSKSQLFFARRTMRRLLGTGRGNGRAGTAVTEEVHDG